ncbi:MAG: hypothetical protein IPK17_21955 [Chloroflexi bacterium]|uniref:hypothetical protein n=1 Tax=Candidatus Flexifilum breve TaxID=3140694 RepID=UPI003137556B|nr:hypothetical protein [Chloroflexota bacterium]
MRQYQQLRQAGVLAHTTSKRGMRSARRAMKVESLFDLLHSAAIIQDGVDGEYPRGTGWIAIEDQSGKQGYIAVTPDQKQIVANIFKLI